MNIREKRLSPRRAQRRSLLPHSPRLTQVRLKPLLLILRPIPPRGGTPTREMPRFRPFPGHPSFDARPESFRGSVPLCGMSSLSHSAAPAQEYRLRLKQIPPNASRRCPPFKSSTAFQALLLLRLFAPCSNGNCVSVLERKIAPRSLFLSKTESKRFRGRRRNKGQWPNRDGDGHSTKQRTLITY